MNTRRCANGRSLAKKSWLVWCIMLITTSVYIGSSIYSPAIGDAADYFGVSEIVSVLGLSLFGTSHSSHQRIS
jgi:DHA1 family multidrug resistance protein-like MFS transporter